MTDVVTDFQPEVTRTYSSPDVVKSSIPSTGLGKSSAQQDVVIYKNGDQKKIVTQSEEATQNIEAERKKQDLELERKIEAEMQAIDAKNTSDRSEREAQAQKRRDATKLAEQAKLAEQDKQQMKAEQDLKAKIAAEKEKEHKAALIRSRAKTEELKKLKEQVEKDQEQMAEAYFQGKEAGGTLGSVLYNPETIIEARKTLDPFAEAIQKRSKRNMLSRGISLAEARQHVVSEIDLSDRNGTPSQGENIILQDVVRELAVEELDKKSGQGIESSRNEKLSGAYKLINEVKLARQYATTGQVDTQSLSCLTKKSSVNSKNKGIFDASLQKGWNEAANLRDPRIEKPWYFPQDNKK